MKKSRNKMQKKTTLLSDQQKSNQSSVNTPIKSSQSSQDITLNIGLTKKLKAPFKDARDDSVFNTKGIGSEKDRAIKSNNKNSKKNIKMDSDEGSQNGLKIDLLQTIMDKQVKGISTMHPNFDETQSPLDPNRSLQDVPSPPPRYKQELNRLLAMGGLSIDHATIDDKRVADTDTQDTKDIADGASMWSLIATPELASHLELLQLGGLIHLPTTFFKPIKTGKKILKEHQPKSGTAKGHVATEAEDLNQHNQNGINANQTDNKAQPQVNMHVKDNLVKESPKLLSPLTKMALLDLSDIYQVCAEHPTLTRYGFRSHETALSRLGNQLTPDKLIPDNKLLVEIPEITNDIFSPNWELILYPERFDNGVDSLVTDILACSVAVHILQQCPTRKTVNRSITAEQICQHMRSYVLNQCKVSPQFEQQYRQIRLFVGHVIMAAYYLGFNITHTDQHKATSKTNSDGLPSQNLGQPIYLNVSSRASLLTRYPNISSYYINGWS